MFDRRDVNGFVLCDECEDATVEEERWTLAELADPDELVLCEHCLAYHGK